jgi:large subunit ribosomal protein L10
VPTDRKLKEVEELRELFEKSSAIVTADHSGVKVGQMTELRRSLREQGVKFRIVKNRLTKLAAEAAGLPAVMEVVEGPTAMAIGFEDPVTPAKALTEFMTRSRVALKIRGGLLGDRALSAAEVMELSALPSKEQLLAKLLGQMNAPITGLAMVLNGPVAALTRVLQRHVDAQATEGGAELAEATAEA